MKINVENSNGRAQNHRRDGVYFLKGGSVYIKLKKRTLYLETVYVWVLLQDLDKLIFKGH